MYDVARTETGIYVPAKARMRQVMQVAIYKSPVDLLSAGTGKNLL